MTLFEVRSCGLVAEGPNAFTVRVESFPVAQFRLKFTRAQMDVLVAEAIVALRGTLVPGPVRVGKSWREQCEADNKPTTNPLL